MTRQVPMDQPLSDEDRAYLHARGLHARVEQMDADFPPDGDVEEEGETRPDWEGMTVDQLKAEIDRVNTTYEPDPPLSKDGKKDELRDRLAKWWDEQ